MAHSVSCPPLPCEKILSSPDQFSAGLNSEKEERRKAENWRYLGQGAGGWIFFFPGEFENIENKKVAEMSEGSTKKGEH